MTTKRFALWAGAVLAAITVGGFLGAAAVAASGYGVEAVIVALASGGLVFARLSAMVPR